MPKEVGGQLENEAAGRLGEVLRVKAVEAFAIAMCEIGKTAKEIRV